MSTFVFMFCLSVCYVVYRKFFNLHRSDSIASSLPWISYISRRVTASHENNCPPRTRVSKTTASAQKDTNPSVVTRSPSDRDKEQPFNTTLPLHHW
jgi:hypothetical protein